MNWNKLGIRLKIVPPESLVVSDYIPVFHRWIQGQVFEDHLLIDVHNYSHVKDGPGILLVAHEGQFSLSFDEVEPPENNGQGSSKKAPIRRKQRHTPTR